MPSGQWHSGSALYSWGNKNFRSSRCLSFRVYSFPTPSPDTDRTLVGLMGPPFQFIVLSLPLKSEKKIEIKSKFTIESSHMLSISCGDLMESGGRYIVLFLDNFSPFQNKDETRIASSPVYFQYDDFIHQQLKKISQQKQ